MNREDFIKNSLIIGGATILNPNSVLAQNISQSGLEKLTDSNGNFIHLPLPYANNYLEPHMDEETLNLHYTFHHGGAVKGANKDLSMVRKAMDEGSFEAVDFWTKKLAYHFSSHILHSIFWTNLTIKKTEPKGQLLKEIEKSFGSFDKLKSLIASTAKNVDGSGWGILGYQPYSQCLTILQCENHEKLTQWGVIPILVIDVWEHAYYLKYKNKRGDFVDSLLTIIDWENVAMRLDHALKIK